MDSTTFSKDKNQYSLSIRFNSDGFSLTIEDQSNGVLSTKSVVCSLSSLSEDEIITLLSQEIETTLGFNNTRLIYESDNYCFIPKALFQKEEAALYLNMQRKEEANLELVFNELVEWDSVVVFAVSTVFHCTLKHLFPNLTLEHHLAYLLTDKLQRRNETSVSVWVREKWLDTVVLQNGAPTLMNSFEYATPEDFTYYVLSLFEQLSLDTEACKVKLFPSAIKPEIKKSLQQYIKSVICE